VKRYSENVHKLALLSHDSSLTLVMIAIVIVSVHCMSITGQTRCKRVYCFKSSWNSL